jgi:endo-1,3(4)-beta-glucanase
MTLRRQTHPLCHHLTSGIASATGTEFTVTDTSGTTYIIYALSSISLKVTSVSSNSGTIQASGAFTGVIRFVKLADASHKALLDQHYQIYPKSFGVDYTFSGSTGTLVFNWNTVGDGSNLLMLTWPHHRLTMQSPNFPATTSLAYLTTKVGYLGSFRMINATYWGDVVRANIP